MKKRFLRIAAGLIILGLFVPAYSEMDDGGTRAYSALLYSITLRHSMAQRDGEKGYLIGTEVCILGAEIYSDVVFAASGQSGTQLFFRQSRRLPRLREDSMDRESVHSARISVPASCGGFASIV